MNIVWIILAAPLAAAVLIALGARRSPACSAALSIGAVALAFALSLRVAAGLAAGQALAPAPVLWLDLPGLQVEWGANLDRLSLLMLLVVTGVGTAIHVFSLGYMRGDPGFARYFGGLSLFTFAMLGIVLATNFIQMYLFWELVGLSSYLLIGFWFERPAAANAAKKALLTNRVGDFGFMIGILMVLAAAGTLDFAALKAAWPVPGLTPAAATLAGLLVFCGAVGKSAQIPLHVWLPDAMEGPTPVSALIHAATMVAAGVYLMCRLSWLLAPSPLALEVVAWTGGLTAVAAALIAVTQRDIKRVLAYSTLSQLGYMMMAVGLGGDVQAMFHLTTHAFFKALLFLAAGSVIAALHHEQDIWKMGGLARRMPFTTLAFLVGTLALAGVWPLSGFYSKDAILLLAFAHNRALFGLAAATAAITAFYMGRVFIAAFLGAPRDAAVHAHARESSIVMLAPLGFLAVLAVIGGWGDYIPQFLLADAHALHGGSGRALMAALLGIPVLGFAAAALVYRNPAQGEETLRRALGPLHRTLAAAFYVDELYALLVRYVQGSLAALCDAADRLVIRRLGVGALVSLSGWGNRLVRRLQNGQVNFYAFALGLGAALILYLVLIFP